MTDPFIITIDGPAGVGKTTLARMLAESLGVAYLDTGAMFRTLALRLGNRLGTLSDGELRESCQKILFSLQGTGQDTVLFCNATPVGDEIRTEQVAHLASRIGQNPVIREWLATSQRLIGAKTSLVAEGRDMGTVIFPSAWCKFFLDASPEIRARRRLEDPASRDRNQTLEALTEQIRARDQADRNRPIAPLRAADDAICIDTSEKSIQNVLSIMQDEIARRS